MGANLPFSLPQKPEFKKLLENVAGRQIAIPTTKRFMETLDRQFEEMKEELKSFLKDQQYVCVTCDVWSARARSFLGVTVHAISKQYERESYVLAFRPLKGKQTFDVLAKEMCAIFREFGLTVEKITNVVTDGGSAFCKSFRIYGKRNDELIIEDNTDELNDDDDAIDLRMPFMEHNGEYLLSNVIDLSNGSENVESQETESTQSDDENSEQSYEPNEEETETIELPPQRRCVSHHLNLVSNDFERELSGSAKTAYISAKSKLHALWVLTSRSSTAKAICIETIGCTLLMPVVTRWNSTFDAMNKSVRPDIKPKINVLIQKLKLELRSARNLIQMTSADWSVIEEYLKVARPIASALDKLQGENNCGQGYILPTIMAMKYHISSQSGRAILTEYKRVMLKVVDKRFCKYFMFDMENRELVLAAVSLPRFKTQFIRDPEDERTAREYLIEACKALSTESNHADRNDTTAEQDEDDFYAAFNNRSTRRSSIEGRIESEVMRYLNDDRKNDSMLDEYPLVRNVYMRYNTTLASSGAVERLFSQSLMVFAPRRNRISDANFEKTLLLKYNKKLMKKKYDK